MDSNDLSKKLAAYFARLQARGLSLEQEEKIRLELAGDLEHGQDAVLGSSGGHGLLRVQPGSLYSYNDLSFLQALSFDQSPAVAMKSLDELLERDGQREEDGFPRKIRVGKMIKPGAGSQDKIVVVPTTVEEKFIHDKVRQPDDEESAGGAGEGEEGEVIGEQPVRPEEGSGEGGQGQGQGGGHEVESNAYDLGRILTEKFQLPNLKDKGKKRFLTRYTYELTDRNRRFGQVLDKKATLREIVKTNIVLGRVGEKVALDPNKFIISPNDKIYRILSKEKDYESQAMVFFIRDYSGSMGGKPTELVVSQHVMVYAWLLFQYDKQVKSRFILHDTEAKEVPDFYSYYNSNVAGGTQVSSAYSLVNKIIEEENLAQDYNIYIFQGTDGDDWDTEGEEAIPELKKMLLHVNRMGITIARNEYARGRKSEVEKYLKASKLLEEQGDLLKLDVLQHDAPEKRMIEGIKKLIE